MSQIDIHVAKAKGRPMLTCVGKKLLARVTAFPAQHIETMPAPDGATVAVKIIDMLGEEIIIKSEGNP